jgi:integrase
LSRCRGAQYRSLPIALETPDNGARNREAPSGRAWGSGDSAPFRQTTNAVSSRNEHVERFTWHALRHFAISCWIDAGLPPKAVQTFAGHSSLQVTMDRYGHLFPSEQHGEVVNAITQEIYAERPSRSERIGAGQWVCLRHEA